MRPPQDGYSQCEVCRTYIAEYKAYVKAAREKARRAWIAAQKKKKGGKPKTKPAVKGRGKQKARHG